MTHERFEEFRWLKFGLILLCALAAGCMPLAPFQVEPGRVLSRDLGYAYSFVDGSRYSCTLVVRLASGRLVTVVSRGQEEYIECARYLPEHTIRLTKYYENGAWLLAE